MCATLEGPPLRVATRASKHRRGWTHVQLHIVYDFDLSRGTLSQSLRVVNERSFSL